MSCASCEDARRVDGAPPECETKLGCIIPSPGPEGARVLGIRSMLVSLRGLVDSASILRMYGAGREDAELLAFVEEELKTMEESAG